MKLFLIGINGRMGKMISQRAEIFGCEIAGGIDKVKGGDYPVFDEAKEVNVDFDVIVDFSHPSVLGQTIELALSRKAPVVLATTGYSDEDIKKIEALSKKVAVFKSANMSLGVNAVNAILPELARILNGYDIEIIEAHHNTKKDAPSGTALMLEKSVEKGLDYAPHLKFGRCGQDKREKGDIGMHAIRGGTIVGEHTVLFAGEDEMIEIKHTALSRKILADGAIRAAIYLKNRPFGLFDMSDLTNSR